MPRGTFKFETTDQGDLINSAMNVEALRKLWLSRKLIKGNDLGPGDPGDFDYGAWHVACHLAGAGGVRRRADGRLMWLEISHDPATDGYYASLAIKPDGANAGTAPIDSAEGRSWLAESTLLGFVEGNSTGRTSARRAADPTDRFNLWRRQDFDQPIESPADGGKVWEHWCTLRDIRPAARIGSSVVAAYVSLVAALGDLFAPTVARGRRDYGHPKQLCALVRAGFTAAASAAHPITPSVVPPATERLLLQADPRSSLQAVSELDWSNPPRYYMFRRKIDAWSPVEAVRHDLKKFKG